MPQPLLNWQQLPQGPWVKKPEPAKKPEPVKKSEPVKEPEPVKMPDVRRSVKFITKQKITDPNQDPPLREWSIEIISLGAHGEELPASANVFDKVKYSLHETFGDRQHQIFKKPPFRISEQGWGEFDMLVTLTAMDKGGEYPLAHDLNFQSERYESKHNITFKNPKGALLEKLRESGTVPGDANGVKAGTESAKKKKKSDKAVDMDKLAENLQKMTEDNLLTVVQMIHDNKTDETFTRNDVDQGEFHVDLYTLPDSLVKDLWAFTASKLP